MEVGVDYCLRHLEICDIEVAEDKWILPDETLPFIMCYSGQSRAGTVSHSTLCSRQCKSCQEHTDAPDSEFGKIPRSHLRFPHPAFVFCVSFVSGNMTCVTHIQFAVFNKNFSHSGNVGPKLEAGSELWYPQVVKGLTEENWLTSISFLCFGWFFK